VSLHARRVAGHDDDASIGPAAWTSSASARPFIPNGGLLKREIEVDRHS
jgi:hypothetical protein